MDPATADGAGSPGMKCGPSGNQTSNALAVGGLQPETSHLTLISLFSFPLLSIPSPPPTFHPQFLSFPFLKAVPLGDLVLPYWCQLETLDLEQSGPLQH